ncbi:hypothetical protein [Falsibacillus albus]|uniref:Uncharacterized protein n=1 Tax=Falsibacillus albus TaxID=2478915 RepID=A0A3L7JQ27_9BACI|nr:hypothetical protein [Falsibacillus albus]RLQ92375.1 hypothetical protein D9X91_19180 [Falsibacillus albus]
MGKSIQMCIRYEVKAYLLPQYHETIKEVAANLSHFDAGHILLHRSNHDPCSVLEMFQVPSEAHFFALKKLRTSREHAIFGSLDSMIDGGVEKMECFGMITDL